MYKINVFLRPKFNLFKKYSYSLWLSKSQTIVSIAGRVNPNAQMAQYLQVEMNGDSPTKPPYQGLLFPKAALKLMPTRPRRLFQPIFIISLLTNARSA
jgi:hypothetical protein